MRAGKSGWEQARGGQVGVSGGKKKEESEKLALEMNGRPIATSVLSLASAFPRALAASYPPATMNGVGLIKSF